MKKKKILFVCTGNICRSPLAHRLFEKIAKEKNRKDHFEVDSCGIGAWHVGDNADIRMQKLTIKKGWKLDKVARQITINDFYNFDIILVMDRGHIASLQSMLKNNPNLVKKIHLFREFDPQTSKEDDEVPDPYYNHDNLDGFEVVYTMIDRTCRKAIDVL